MKKLAYTFTTLRYVHDVASGESLNVGVAIHVPSSRFVGARIQTNYGRLKKAFPALDGEEHKNLMRFLQARFDTLQIQSAQELALWPDYKDVCSVVAAILPHDDSSLRWSEMAGGLTSDPETELEHLYSRLVLANEISRSDKGRDDDLIWSQFRAPLAREKVLVHLTHHKIVAQSDEVEFEHAWRNREWHCLLPFSLDLLDPDSIKDKAHRVLGQMVGVREQISDHRLYLMVGEPQLEKCRNAANRALTLLHANLPLPSEIIREQEAESFSREFAAKIRANDHGTNGRKLFLG
jgi:hypothetical protein